jgi:ATP-dependent DNA helicase HFM1/MER3
MNTQLTTISAKKLDRGQEVMFEAKLTTVTQTVRAYVMCDTIGMLQQTPSMSSR